MSTLSTTAAASSIINAGALSVSGLATGLDTEKIITGLVALQQKRIDNLQIKQNRIVQQQTAFRGVEAKVLALQAKLFQLGRTQGSVFDGRQVTSSDDDLVTAAASGTAATGTYRFKVNALASAHQLGSQGYDAATSTITQGTLQLRAGAGTTVTLTIDNTNNTLQGLASAINSSGAGVTATLVNDGSSAQPYRLLLSANQTGAANGITLVNNLGADGGGASRPVFDASYIGAARTDVGFAGTAAITANAGAGAFAGTANNAYRFTVIQGGTVGVDDNVQLAYADTTGSHTGTITLNAADVDTFKTVAEGIQVKFAAGTLVAGDSFTVKGYIPLVQQAADASITLGSGVSPLTVAGATNQVNNLFPGVTLNLNDADSGKTVTLNVSQDTSKAKTGILDFVSGFNDLMGFIDEQTGYDAATGTAGLLLGNSQVRAIQEQVRSAVLGTVAGLKTTMNRGGAAGITVDEHGKLNVNQSKLDDALAGRIAGVTFDDVRRLFVLGASSSLAGVDFVTGSSKTRATGSPFDVQITQAARQATLTATNALAASTILTGANNTLAVKVDGITSGTITLPAGTYTRQALARELQAQIHADPTLGGRQVSIAVDGDRLTFTSTTYGSTSSVAVLSGSALAPLGFAGTETGQGVDVAGHFQVDGVTEAATGSGQFLTGNAANATTADLMLRVTLTSAQVGAGVAGGFTVTRGLASLADNVMAGLLEPVSGRLRNADDGFNRAIENVKKEVDRQNQLMENQRRRLQIQFAAMESTVSRLQGISAYLTAQFQSLQKK